MNCANPECGHAASIHDAGGPCRKTRCTCTGLVVEEAKVPGGRRISIDVPDGYMVTVSLVPYSEPEA